MGSHEHRSSVHSLASTINGNNLWKYKDEQTPMAPDLTTRRKLNSLEKIDDASENDSEKFSGQGKPTPCQFSIEYGPTRGGAQSDAGWRDEVSVDVHVDQIEAIFG